MDKEYLENKKNEIIGMAHDYEGAFGTESGIRVLDDLKKSFYNRRSHVRGDSHETAFRDGQRDVVRKIIKFLDLSRNPDQLERSVSKQSNWVDE